MNNKVFKIVIVIMDLIFIPFTIYEIINKEYNYIAWIMLLLCNILIIFDKKKS